MSKRILSLDLLRGIAIFAMIFVHVFVNSSEIMRADPFESLPMIVFFVFIFVFGHFRGFFILISGAAAVYTITAKSKQGRPLKSILKNQVFLGVFLIVFGHLKDTFINQWGIFRQYYLAGGFRAENFDWAAEWAQYSQMGLISEAIQSIGWCLLLTSLIYGAMLKFRPGISVKASALIMLGLTVVVLYVSPPIQQALSNLVNFDVTSGSEPWRIEKEGLGYLWVLLIFDIAGAQSPIFPMLAYSLIGGVIGVYLSQESLSSNFPRRLTGFGALILLGGIIDFAIHLLFVPGFEFDPFFHVHPSWYVLIAIGIQVMLVALTFRLIEFNPRLTVEQMKKRTLYLRRWSFVALTVYSLQILEYIPRAILAEIFPASNLDLWTRTPLQYVLLFMLLNWAMWELILRLNDRVANKWSLEYPLLLIAKRGNKIKNAADPLNLQGNLYDVEPILFGQNPKT